VLFQHSTERSGKQIESLQWVDPPKEKNKRYSSRQLEPFTSGALVGRTDTRQFDPVRHEYDAVGAGQPCQLVELELRRGMEPCGIADNPAIGERVHESLAPRVVRQCRGRQHATRREHIWPLVVPGSRRRTPYNGIPQAVDVKDIGVAQLGCDDGGE
jgi:hypothetical protein